MAKQEKIKYLTELMAAVQMAYFGGREVGVHVNEAGKIGSPCSIDLDLYGDCVDNAFAERLHGVTLCYGEGVEPKTGWVYNMGYDPDDDDCLYFLFLPDGEDLDWTILPEDLPEEVLAAITAWLEKAMEPAAPEKFQNGVTSFFFYMWNAWCEDECKKVFGKDDFYPHFWKKWCYSCDMHNRFGAVEHFYAELSDGNRDKLVRRALEVYDGNHEKKC